MITPKRKTHNKAKGNRKYHKESGFFSFLERKGENNGEYH